MDHRFARTGCSGSCSGSESASENLLEDSASDAINSARLVLLELVDSLSDASDIMNDAGDVSLSSLKSDAGGDLLLPYTDTENAEALRTSLSDSVSDRGIVLLVLGLVVSLSDARDILAPTPAR